MVGWCEGVMCEGVMYLTPPGHPTDIGLQLGKAILVAGKGKGECFYFFCFITFFLVPLFHLIY